MDEETPTISLKAIGTVKNEFKQPIRQDWGKVVSDIVVESSLTEALDGLEDFSHIIVLYWMHRAPSGGKAPTKVHPRGKEELPLVGLFASRSPHRPNSVGLATVKLLNRQGNMLRVEGLDAIDGTPVIDIKPHIARYDSPINAKAAPWVNKR